MSGFLTYVKDVAAFTAIGTAVSIASGGPMTGPASWPVYFLVIASSNAIALAMMPREGKADSDKSRLQSSLDFFHRRNGLGEVYRHHERPIKDGRPRRHRRRSDLLS